MRVEEDYRWRDKQRRKGSRKLGFAKTLRKAVVFTHVNVANVHFFPFICYMVEHGVNISEK